MRVFFLDECVDPRVKRLLPEHAVATVHERGWDSLKDGPLLRAADGHFDVLLTIDGKLEFQQNLSQFRIAIICGTRS